MKFLGYVLSVGNLGYDILATGEDTGTVVDRCHGLGLSYNLLGFYCY